MEIPSNLRFPYIFDGSCLLCGGGRYSGPHAAVVAPPPLLPYAAAAAHGQVTAASATASFRGGLSAQMKNGT